MFVTGLLKMVSPKFPKVLVVALGRINANDLYNNGLFLRNLFGAEWPKDNLAQIFSSGDTGDSGFFARYYCLGPQERVLGDLFYRVRPNQIASSNAPGITPSGVVRREGLLKRVVNSLLVETGLYELVFRPKLSREMLDWVNEFKPDVILAQGYNLTFSWLPLMLKKETGAKLAVLTTDDWPKYLYSGLLGESKIFRWVVRPFVSRAARNLFAAADIPCAFGLPMAEEYKRRYGKNFFTFDHTDNAERFLSAKPIKVSMSPTRTIVAIGTFNEYRLPLLLDIDRACEALSRRGLDIRLAVFSSAIYRPGRAAVESAKYIDVYPDPGHDALPSYLKGADVLLLAEGFEEDFVSAIELSVSSKSHLFMLSKKPILVYGAEKTGVVKYAKNLSWGRVVSERSITVLADAIYELLENKAVIERLISSGWDAAEQNHSRARNQAKFFRALGVES